MNLSKKKKLIEQYSFSYLFLKKVLTKNDNYHLKPLINEHKNLIIRFEDSTIKYLDEIIIIEKSQSTTIYNLMIKEVYQLQNMEGFRLEGYCDEFIKRDKLLLGIIKKGVVENKTLKQCLDEYLCH